MVYHVIATIAVLAAGLVVASAVGILAGSLLSEYVSLSIAIDHYLPGMRLQKSGNHAHNRVPMVLRMRVLSRTAKTSARRLLRFLLVRLG